MAKDEEVFKYEFLKGYHLFRFPFTIKAMRWGMSLGVLLGFHRFLRVRNLQSAINFGMFGGSLCGLGIWAQQMYVFTVTHEAMKTQERRADEEIEERRMVKEYLRDKYHLDKRKISYEKLMDILEEKDKNYSLEED
eukprot:CAMPEP_0114977278 /NCGR_PEP_ID=MMETSP0216-20121206/3148_1 /TAXON_ID=223996 /ORGANISM="Protocruzia adherens, Strain Boccale" /LENGTH=135 /DNA_ID=CAMNT_0002338317 /DNA_START=12 /DNA_END=419 /DNA_ORIENTATION=-